LGEEDAGLGDGGKVRLRECAVEKRRRRGGDKWQWRIGAVERKSSREKE
jgi:hypothetical protein